MTASPQFLKAYKKATGQTVEKPGNAEHSAKFDRCVLEVQGKGGVEDAYAVCTEAMKSDTIKSMSHNDPGFSKEVEQFMRTLGISGAGPVPHSLMARQDLESGRTTKTMEFAKKRITKDGSNTLSVWYHDNYGNRKCEVFANIVDAEASVKRLTEMGYKDVYIVTGAGDMVKTGDKMFLIRTNGMEYARFDKKADAEECLAMLTAQGQFAVMIEETVLSAAEKGRVEVTGKQLDHAVKEAAEAEDTEEKSTLVDNIKNIQLRRQKATIAERSKSAAVPSAKAFKDVWGKITRPK